jgi:hypothetical protein
MFDKFKNIFVTTLFDSEEKLLSRANEECKRFATTSLRHLDIFNYTYDPNIAVDELGLDRELVEQLIQDYVRQVIRATVQFEKFMIELQDSKAHNKALDYTPFRELAHKNLGVARNLRIQDAQVLLTELLKKDDLDYLVECMEALKFCAVKLCPKCAFDTIRLIHVKKALS